MSGKGSICAVYGCSNYRKQKDSKSFFRFPRNKDICQLWVVRSRRADLDAIFKANGPEHLNNSYVVCSDHFVKKDFRNENLLSQGIWPGSVPSVFPSIKEINPRRSPKKRKLEEDYDEEETNHEEDSKNCDISTDQMKCEGCIKLTHKCKLLQKRVSRYICLTRSLRKDLNNLKQEHLKCKSEVRFASNNASETFINMQEALKGRKPQGRRYSELDKSFALALHFCSSKAYRFLRSHFFLPTIRSLRMWLQNAEVKPGVNNMILDLLEMKCEKMKAKEKIISVVIDEMSLKSLLTYSVECDMFEGFEDLGKEIPDECERQLCNQAMVVMIKGLYLNFKQVIAYYLSKDAMPGEKIREILITILVQIKSTGLVPKVVVCDQGTNNVKMRKLLGVTSEKPFIEVNGEKIYFFYDAPHLIKSVRNNLKKYDFNWGGRICSWNHIEDFYNKDSIMIPRLAPKLTKQCIILPPFSPMRVCLAVRALSHSVSAGIKVHVAFNSLPSSSSATADFIEMMDILFDIFNSSKSSSPKQYRKPLCNISNHLSKLEEIQGSLKKIIVLNKGSNEKSNPKCIQGWIDNISALKNLWSELSGSFDFKFLFTRRLTQDCIENTFSILRGKGGNNVTPDASKFRSALRTVMVNSLLSPSQDGNCEVDAAAFLIQRREIDIKNFTVCLENLPNEDDNWSEDNVPLEQPTQSNADNYVMGWTLSKLPHSECRSALSSEENANDLNNLHIQRKRYEGNKMIFPNKCAQKLSSELSNIFNCNFNKFLLESTHSVKTKLMKAADNAKISADSVCGTCFGLLAKKYFSVMIKAYVNKTNDSCAPHTKKNVKLKKILHT